ncbi:hypothetical protein [Winogradskyella flava]|uniref:hypothetical protein n=1 Tax=Winogradskyella flava TaxID=1884876 RepID=UPI0024912248|nr:hypothetical protein [Winogradskyella flava]
MGSVLTKAEQQSINGSGLHGIPCETIYGLCDATYQDSYEEFAGCMDRWKCGG